MASGGSERKLAVILHADVVDSTVLVHRDERLAHDRIQDVFGRLAKTIDVYGGKAHEIRGDALLAEYGRASDAVSAALAFQAANSAHNGTLDDDIRPEVRIGISLGEVVVADNTLTGPDVVLAQRLEQLAEPGGVCISKEVQHALPNRLPFDYADLGDQDVKGFDRPVHAYSVTLQSGGAVPAPEPRVHVELPDKPSVAVLPFTNLTDDPAQEYFSDGITEDIITGLSKNPYLSVISRNSSFTYKGKSARIREVGENLGAQYVMEGSVRRAGQRIRVTAQLIDAQNDRHLWAESYDRDLDDIFAVQDEVVGSIVHALGASDGALEKSARQRSVETSATNSSAYDCYLQAQEHFYRPGDAGFDEAEALYEKAIELDPDFSRAYSGLATLHFLRFKLFLTASFESIEQKTLDLALQAVRRDADDYLGHWILGRVYSYQGKHAQSLAEFDRALHINPNDANLLVISAEHLVYCGRMEMALERCQRAIRLNPNCPDWYWWELGFAYFHLHRYEDALASLQQMTSLDQAHRLLAAVYSCLGRIDEARAEGQEYLKIVPDFSINEWARTEPYIDPEELQLYVDGLRMAGLPD